MPLCGRPLVPDSSLGIILLDAQPLVVQRAQIELRFRLPFLGQRSPLQQCSLVVIPGKRRHARQIIGLARYRNHHQTQKNERLMQIFHKVTTEVSSIILS